jgi:hypothetical protein
MATFFVSSPMFHQVHLAKPHITGLPERIVWHARMS